MDFQINLTDLAAKKIKQILSETPEGKHIALWVSGGGCSGLKYGMGVVGDVKEEEVLHEVNGVSFVVNPLCSPYLNNITIDWSDELIAGGFKIQNPNALRECGCRQSFTPKGEEEKSGGCSSCVDGSNYSSE